jgi:peptidoglycan/LPS O-acetylase OafA/YrhL
MNYRPSLDGLRGVAVSAVVLFHAHKSFCQGGWSGVDIFFVLSGYLITENLIIERFQYQNVSLKYFYVRRVLRLMPAFVCLILVLMPLSLLSSHHTSVYLEEILFSLTYLMNWNRAFGWDHSDGGILAHTWSLSMEEQFYLIWPLIFIYISRIQWVTKYVPIAIAIIVLCWRTYLITNGTNFNRTYNGFDTHSDSLLIGCALSFFLNDRSIIPIFAARFSVLPIAALIATLGFSKLEYAYSQTVGITIVAVSTAWIIAASSRNTVVTKVLSFKPLVYSGKISYGWYLWHYPFLMIGRHMFPHSQLTVPILVILSYITAIISHHFIERPFLRLKPRFESRDPSNFSDLMRKTSSPV